jgi:integrase
VIKPRQRRTAAQTEALINGRLVRAWRGRRITAITRGDVIRLLDGEIDAGRGRTANKLLAVTRRLFDWAAEGHDLDRNPAAGISRPGVERSRERVLDDEELGEVWRAAGEMGWPWGPYVRLLLLSGQRRSEVGGMQWSEIDLGGATWVLPSSRSKSKRAHVIPLSDAAVEILQAAPRLANGETVFWTARTGLTGYAQAKSKLDRLITRHRAEAGLPPLQPWTLHDLTRSAATGWPS